MTARQKIPGRRVPGLIACAVTCLVLQLPGGGAFAQTAGATGQAASPIRVPYLTLRDVTGADDPASFFGSGRDQLRAGICEVESVHYESINSLARGLPFYVPDTRLGLNSISSLPLTTFWDDVDQLNGQPCRNVVLYLHGYNIGFAKGCQRAARLQQGVGLDGRLVLFSWPSDGNVLNYARDEADLYWSVPVIEQTVAAMVARYGEGRVDLVAHSMGARGLMLALSRLAASSADGPLIEQLVLVAPDIDSAIFGQELPALRRLVRRLTLYVSANDRALSLSENLHGYPRLGQLGPHLAGLEGIDIIDVSEAGRPEPTGHLYHLYNDVVHADIARLLSTGEAVAERPGMQTAGSGGLRLWRLSGVSAE